MKLMKGILSYVILLFGVSLITGTPVCAREVIHLTLDESIDVVMGKSYRIKQLQMGIETSDEMASFL